MFTLRLQKAAALLAVLISRRTRGYLSPSAFTMTIFDLPPINATLNGPSTLRICGGWISILRDRKPLPLVFLTVIPSLRSRFDRHRKMGKFTLPIWLYVSETGVIVYFMLYQWFPSTHFEELKKRYEVKIEAAKH